MIDFVNEALEDNRAAMVMTSLDFSKAFNRLNHRVCLSEFAKKGASNGILKIIAGFLTGRTMQVKIGNTRSNRRNVTVGAPQGSVLGSFLFNVGINTLGDGLAEEVEEIVTEHHLRRDDFPTVSTPVRVTEPTRPPNLSPIKEDGPEVDILPRVTNAPP